MNTWQPRFVPATKVNIVRVGTKPQRPEVHLFMGGLAVTSCEFLGPKRPLPLRQARRNLIPVATSLLAFRTGLECVKELNRDSRTSPRIEASKFRTRLGCIYYDIGVLVATPESKVSVLRTILRSEPHEWGIRPGNGPHKGTGRDHPCALGCCRTACKLSRSRASSRAVSRDLCLASSRSCDNPRADRGESRRLRLPAGSRRELPERDLRTPRPPDHIACQDALECVALRRRPVPQDIRHEATCSEDRPWFAPSCSRSWCVRTADTKCVSSRHFSRS